MWPCSTSQPGDAFERPVIVHRAVLGSVERMFAILTENFRRQVAPLAQPPPGERRHSVPQHHVTQFQ